MRRKACGLLAIAAVVAVLAGCGSGQSVGFAANHAGHPIVGRWFSGLTVRGIGGTQLTSVDCRLAWLRHWAYGSVPSRARRFYVPGTHRLAKVVCVWKIPKTAAGEWFHGCAAGYFAKGAEECGAFESVPIWRIRRS